MIDLHRCNAQAFSLFGGVYNAMTAHPIWAEQNRKLADHWGELPANATVVDLGAGTGIGTLALEALVPPGGHIIGLDLTPAMVERAQRRLEQAALPEGRVNFVQGDATSMPHIASGSVDAVVANSFLYLVPDPVAVLREVHRVLAKGGRVVFMEPCAEGSVASALTEGIRHSGAALQRPVAATQLVAAMTAWRVVSGLFGRRTRAELTELFAKAGFSDVRFEPTLGSLGQHVIATR